MRPDPRTSGPSSTPDPRDRIPDHLTKAHRVALRGQRPGWARTRSGRGRSAWPCPGLGPARTRPDLPTGADRNLSATFPRVPPHPPDDRDCSPSRVLRLPQNPRRFHAPCRSEHWIHEAVCRVFRRVGGSLAGRGSKPTGRSRTSAWSAGGGAQALGSWQLPPIEGSVPVSFFPLVFLVRHGRLLCNGSGRSGGRLRRLRGRRPDRSVSAASLDQPAAATMIPLVRRFPVLVLWSVHVIANKESL
jgi:hypothetical protein